MPEEETFKVTDRRGRSKESESPGTSAVGSEPAPESPRSPTGDAPSSRPSRSRPAGAAPADLQHLFVMFASSALIHLGEAPDPMTGTTALDLPHAQEAIDMLILLRDKTAGNRTDQESRLLEDILYDLQMRFVRVSREQTAR